MNTNTDLTGAVHSCLMKLVRYSGEPSSKRFLDAIEVAKTLKNQVPAPIAAMLQVAIDTTRNT